MKTYRQWLENQLTVLRQDLRILQRCGGSYEEIEIKAKISAYRKALAEYVKYEENKK